MRRAISSVISLLAGIALAAPAVAEVSIVVDKTTQRMIVSVNGEQRYTWPVSTGTVDYSTPAGTFTPSRLARVHYSREWDNAPMPLPEHPAKRLDELLPWSWKAPSSQQVAA
jgi:lipoprotein-anchoring transpeptidase ErfK/SrfK